MPSLYRARPRTRTLPLRLSTRLPAGKFVQITVHTQRSNSCCDKRYKVKFLTRTACHLKRTDCFTRNSSCGHPLKLRTIGNLCDFTHEPISSRARGSFWYKRININCLYATQYERLVRVRGRARVCGRAMYKQALTRKKPDCFTRNILSDNHLKFAKEAINFCDFLHEPISSRVRGSLWYERFYTNCLYAIQCQQTFNISKRII